MALHRYLFHLKSIAPDVISGTETGVFVHPCTPAPHPIPGSIGLGRHIHHIYEKAECCTLVMGLRPVGEFRYPLI